MEDKRPAPYPLRMPGDMRAKIEQHAHEAGRSLNAEILHRLEESFRTPITHSTDEQFIHAFAYSAFKATSEDFEEELCRRAMRYLVEVMKRKDPSEAGLSEDDINALPMIIYKALKL